jgi:hypothetical protein
MGILLEVRTDFNEEPQFMASKKHPCGQEEEFEIGLLCSVRSVYDRPRYLVLKILGWS